MNRWLTTTEAAAIMGVSPATVWKWAHNGTIPAASILKVGRNRRVDRVWCDVPAPEKPAAIVPGSMSEDDARLLEVQACA